MNVGTILQKELLAAILSSEEFLLGISANIFQDSVFKKLTETSKEYFKKFEIIPTISHLEHLVDVYFLSEEKPRALEILATLPFPSFFSKEIIKQKIIQASLWKTASNVSEFLADTDMEKYPDKVIQKITELQKWSEDILVVGNTDEEFSEVFSGVEERTKHRVEEETEMIPTLMYEVDKVFSGGVERGTLNCILGASGQGKSIFLVNIAWGAAVAGYDVYFVTLEISTKKTLDRIDMRACGMLSTELKCDFQKIKQKYDIYKNSLNVGNIYVQYLSNANVYTIKNQIKKLKRRKGKVPSVLIVDYADLLVPLNKTAEMRHQLEHSFKKLRDIAVEENIVAWTASQLNREGAKKYHKSTNATKEDIAEGWLKVAVCDTVSVLTETGLFLDKVRDNPSKKHVPLHIDLSKMQMKSLPTEASLLPVNTNTGDLFPKKEESVIIKRQKNLLKKFGISEF